MKIYLAGSTKEIDRVKALGRDLAPEGHEVLHAWTNMPQDGTAPPERMIWQMCFRQIREASALVAVVPFYEEHQLNGGVCEVGYALGRGLPVILYDFQGHQSGNWKHAPGVTIVTNTFDLIDELKF